MRKSDKEEKEEEEKEERSCCVALSKIIKKKTYGECRGGFQVGVV